jgi:cysteinyl-tRNA synthetase
LANEAIKKKAVSKRYKDELKLAINKMDSVLGLLRVNDVPSDVKEMLAKREEARRRSDWNTADLIRDEIKNKGFDVVDLEGLGPLILKTLN